MRRVVICGLSIVLGAMVLAACGSSSDQAERVTLAALRLAHPLPKPESQEPTIHCAHATASLRPPAVMPAPGSMPGGSFMANIKRRGYLRVGVDQNTYRFAYFNPRNGQIEGFEVGLARQIAQAIFGSPNPKYVHFIAITTDERIPAVQQRQVDMVVDAMTITCYRRTKVDFSSVYYRAGQRILVPFGSHVTSVKQLGGKPVCVTKHSTSLTTLEGLVPRPAPYLVDQRTDCLVALQEGFVKAITSDDSILLGFKAQDPDTHIVGPSLAKEPYGIAINRAHPNFVRFVNGVLARLGRNGQWRAMYKHWLGNFTTGATPMPPRPQYDG
jgi:polar amino acid transport system substrate-binding protein